jgi:hypothetical protein
MIEVLISCVITPLLLTTDIVVEYRECQDIRTKLHYVLDWHDTVDNYFESEDGIIGTVVNTVGKGQAIKC